MQLLICSIFCLHVIFMLCRHYIAWVSKFSFIISGSAWSCNVASPLCCQQPSACICYVHFIFCIRCIRYAAFSCCSQCCSMWCCCLMSLMYSCLCCIDSVPWLANASRIPPGPLRRPAHKGQLTNDCVGQWIVRNQQWTFDVVAWVCVCLAGKRTIGERV